MSHSLLNPKFTAAQFTATPYESAAEKASFANQFMAFVAAGYPRSKFTKVFYRKLSNTFGHIAHYDIEGFFEEFFEREQDQVRFMAHTLRYQPVGSPEHTYSDVERAIQTRLLDARDSGLLAA